MAHRLYDRLPASISRPLTRKIIRRRSRFFNQARATQFIYFPSFLRQLASSVTDPPPTHYPTSRYSQPSPRYRLESSWTNRIPRSIDDPSRETPLAHSRRHVRPRLLAKRLLAARTPNPLSEDRAAHSRLSHHLRPTRWPYGVVQLRRAQGRQRQLPVLVRRRIHQQRQRGGRRGGPQVAPEPQPDADVLHGARRAPDQQHVRAKSAPLSGRGAAPFFPSSLDRLDVMPILPDADVYNIHVDSSVCGVWPVTRIV